MRIAVIGTNFITDRMLTAARLCPEIEPVLVYSRTEARGREFAAKWNIPRFTASFEALERDPDVDAVYLASPNSCHAWQAERLLRAGKHVLCEKPAARSAAEWDEMLAAARESGALLLEAMRTAFLPQPQAVREALPEIGPVRRARISYCKYSSRYDKFKAGVVENAFDPRLGNGALMDIGVYCVSTMVQLFGTPRAVTAKSWFLPQSIDGMGTAICEYDGFHAELAYSKVNDGSTVTEIDGEKGNIRCSLIAQPYGATLERGGETRQLAGAPELPEMAYELRAFARFAADPSLAQPHQQRTRDVLAVMDEIRRQTGIDFTVRSHGA